MSTPPRIVVVDSFTADQGDVTLWDDLRLLGEVAIYPRSPAATVLERCAGATAIVTNKVQINADLIRALPELRYVGVAATGMNNIDLEACRARSIIVRNVEAYAGYSVAQLAFSLILHFVQQVPLHDVAAKQGAWSRAENFCLLRSVTTELAGKTLVLIGSGAIGGSLARMAQGFDLRVIAAQVPGSRSAGRTPLSECLPIADIVSLHCPLTETTRHLVDRDFLHQVKAGAILINTSRGGLIDEAALVAALEEGRLKGAGLDVLDTEPPAADHPLLNPAAPWADRVVVTPHIGWATVEARTRLIREVIRHVTEFFGQEG